MFRKAPWIPALLLGVGALLPASAGADVIGAIDTPTVNQRVSGVVRVSGFALSFHSVSDIVVLVDGVVVNRADLNIPRADVLEVFPNYFNSPTRDPGFLSAFLARNYSNGQHSVVVRVTESTGAITLLGPVTVVVDNTVNQAPFGFVDIPSAAVVEGASGSFPVTGWAVDDQDVDHIDFLVDGQVVAGAVGRGLPGTANFGSPRPDVYAAFPDFPGPAPKSLFSGFIANIDTTRFLNGLHTITVRATDNQGLSALIGTRTVQIENNGGNLAPFGRIDFPLDKATFVCSGTFQAPPTPGPCPSPCVQPPPNVSPLNPNIVKGWVLDTGARLDKGQTAFAELLIDGSLIANTRANCVFVNGAPNNCYGVNRPDVAALFPGYVNTDNSGYVFLFTLSPNAATGLLNVSIPNSLGLINAATFVAQIAPGKHTLSVRAGDDTSTVTQIATQSFDVLCDATSGDRPAIGFIDNPAVYQFINGIFPFYGWAFDPDGIRTIGGVPNGVELDIDGIVIARIGNTMFRPDVPANDPRVNTPNVGWLFNVDTTKLTDGEHEIVVYVVDGIAGHLRTEIGRKKFVVQNNVLINQ